MQAGYTEYPGAPWPGPPSAPAFFHDAPGGIPGPSSPAECPQYSAADGSAHPAAAASHALANQGNLAAQAWGAEPAPDAFWPAQSYVTPDAAATMSVGPFATPALPNYTGTGSLSGYPAPKRRAHEPLRAPRQHKRVRQQEQAYPHYFDQSFPAHAISTAPPPTTYFALPPGARQASPLWIPQFPPPHTHHLPSSHHPPLPVPSHDRHVPPAGPPSGSLSMDALLDVFCAAPVHFQVHEFSATEMPSALRDFFESRETPAPGRDDAMSSPGGSFAGGTAHPAIDDSRSSFFPPPPLLDFSCVVTELDCPMPMSSPGTTAVSDGDASTLVMSPPPLDEEEEDEDPELNAARAAVRDCADPKEMTLLLAQAANLLIKRYNDRPAWCKTPAQDLLRELVDLQTIQLRQVAPDHPDRLAVYAGLGSSMCHLYAWIEDGAPTLEAAIAYLHEAVLLLAKWPQDKCRLSICRSLSQCYKHRYLEGKLVEDLQKSIALQHLALELLSESDPDRPGTCWRYAACLEEYYKAVGDESDLDIAIKFHREALSLLSEQQQMEVRGLLARCLHHRYRLTGDEGVFDEAIDQQRKALSTMPKHHRYRSWASQELACSLQQRAICGQGDDVVLEEAISHHRAAIALFGTAQPMRAESVGNLGQCLWEKYYRTGGVLLLSEVVACEEEALDYMREDRTYAGPASLRLADALRLRFACTGNPELQIRAIAHEEYAASLGYPRLAPPTPAALGE